MINMKNNEKRGILFVIKNTKFWQPIFESIGNFNQTIILDKNIFKIKEERQYLTSPLGI